MTSGRKQSTSKDASVPQGALYKNLKFPHKILLKNIKLKPNLCLQLGKLFEWFSRYFLTKKKIETKMNLSGMHNKVSESQKTHIDCEFRRGFTFLCTLLVFFSFSHYLSVRLLSSRKKVGPRGAKPVRV